MNIGIRIVVLRYALQGLEAWYLDFGKVILRVGGFLEGGEGVFDNGSLFGVCKK